MEQRLHHWLLWTEIQLLLQHHDDAVHKPEPDHTFSANVSINKTFKTVDVFIDDCFNKDGSYKVDQDFKKRGVLNKCKWCEFADKPDICDKLYVEREDKWYRQLDSIQVIL